MPEGRLEHDLVQWPEQPGLSLWKKSPQFELSVQIAQGQVNHEATPFPTVGPLGDTGECPSDSQALNSGAEPRAGIDLT